ncbi:phytoene desaturase family protein, partial [Sphingorhabdus sp.]|uniref:phytoene desaturase family protein n=1 Tax=Sphingorhabdus sp. TaxID=1902408 RepID=UPI00391C7424
MRALAEALRRIAEEHGARFRLGTAVRSIEVSHGRASAIILDDGERLSADAIVVNADPATMAGGYLGDAVRKSVPNQIGAKRSLSAMVWLAHARTSDFPLSRHNVFFSPDYPREFRDIAGGGSPRDPSVYVCAQDRSAGESDHAKGRERLQIIVNAPPNGDSHSYTIEETEQCTLAMSRSLRRCGLELEDPFPHRLLTPNEFEAFSPGTGGAIYGRASHGWAASFLRQGTRTRIPGLYCAGGSTHPGAGVPMAALSGQLAARTVMQDRASTRRFHPVATAGGTSTRRATPTVPMEGNTA